MNVLPVELNAILCQNANLLANFVDRVKPTSSLKPKAYYDSLNAAFQRSIHSLLWDEEAGVWFDFDLRQRKKRRQFYPSNIFPMWRVGKGCEHQG